MIVRPRERRYVEPKFFRTKGLTGPILGQFDMLAVGHSFQFSNVEDHSHFGRAKQGAQLRPAAIDYSQLGPPPLCPVLIR
jgi:hypothetical protein